MRIIGILVEVILAGMMFAGMLHTRRMMTIKKLSENVTYIVPEHIRTDLRLWSHVAFGAFVFIYMMAVMFLARELPFQDWIKFCSQIAVSVIGGHFSISIGRWLGRNDFYSWRRAQQA